MGLKMRKKVIRPKKQKALKAAAPVPIADEDPPIAKKNKRGRPKKSSVEQPTPKRGRTVKHENGISADEDSGQIDQSSRTANLPSMENEEMHSEALHMSTMQVKSLSSLVACKECGEEVELGVRPTTKGMINEFTATCKVCGSHKSTNTPNLIRERKRKREVKGIILQKTENINYAHVAAFLDNGLGYSGLRHYCKYLNARCLNEATFICYARQVIADTILETDEFLQQNARIVRKAFETQLESDHLVDVTVGYTTTYHQWGSDFCLVAGAVIELQTGLVLDYDVANMYCHVCKINAKKIVSMTPSEMTDWFNKHQDTCEIREWCDEIDQDAEEGVKEIDPKYLEAFIAKKLWVRSIEKFGFRYTTLIHESDDRIHSELLRAAPYGDLPVMIDAVTNCFSRRKSEHARTSFQNKLKSKCPRERVQTKDRILYVYAMSIPEYNKFAIGSNIKLRELVRKMEEEEMEESENTLLHGDEQLIRIHGEAVHEIADGEQIFDSIEGDEEEEDVLEEGEIINIPQSQIEQEEEEIEDVRKYVEAMENSALNIENGASQKNILETESSPDSKAALKESIALEKNSISEVGQSNEAIVKPFRVDFDED